MANSYKRLGAVRPADTNEAKLYGPAASTSAIVSVTICNQDSSDRTFRLAHTNTDAAADNEDWIYYDQAITANSSIQITGLCLYTPETIRVRASVADKISFVASGLEIT